MFLLTEQALHESWEVLCTIKASCWANMIHVNFLFLKPFITAVAQIFIFLPLIRTLIGPTGFHFAFCYRFPKPTFLPETTTNKGPKGAFCHSASISRPSNLWFARPTFLLDCHIVIIRECHKSMKKCDTLQIY